ncbi:MAG: hypothetical protein OJI67_21625 [Prosthecobacter sp.]|nr:hypothetical protein [Prosthecobacter sp.]
MIKPPDDIETQTELMAWFEERVMDAILAHEAALVAGDWREVFVCVRARFEAQLMVALLRWGAGGDVAVSLRQLVALVLEAAEQMRVHLPALQPFRELPLSCSLYLALLVDLPHPPLPVELYAAHELGEVTLANHLAGAADLQSFVDGFTRLPDSSRYAVLYYTLQNYLGLVVPESQESQAQLLTNLQVCFDCRAEDAFYCARPAYEGGGVGNAWVVDFRLAAVLKKLGCKDSTPHALWEGGEGAAVRFV